MIFPNKNEKRIPKTLHECIKPDSTVISLNHWAERIESWGQLLLALLIIAGTFSTMAEAISLMDTSKEMVFPAVISSVITWGLYALLAYCAYHVLALLMSALASITQHTIITANVALFESYNASDDEME